MVYNGKKSVQKAYKTHWGTCLCGEVCFKINGKLRNVVNCHCGQCLKTHGHFSAYTAVNKKNIKFVKKNGLKWYKSSDEARRGFCSVCGASIFFERIDSHQISISAGMLKLFDGIESVKHIFYDEKPSYYNVIDNLPKFSQYSSTKLFNSKN